MLRQLAVVRAIQRAGQLGLVPKEKLTATVGSSLDELDDLYRLLALAKYVCTCAAAISLLTSSHVERTKPPMPRASL